jgi:hypothetical protein
VLLRDLDVDVIGDMLGRWIADCDADYLSR